MISKIKIVTTNNVVVFTDDTIKVLYNQSYSVKVHVEYLQLWERSASY